MSEVSEDIFYKVKKEILDKLDVILQRINLEIINYVKPEEAEFSFIQLSSFEAEITGLFEYLDRLYASLSSSVSYSTIKEASSEFVEKNHELERENNQLKSFMGKIVKDFNHREATFRRDCFAQLEKKLLEEQNKVTVLSREMKQMSRSLKKSLKTYKFDLLETRVEIISKMKQFGQRISITQEEYSKTEPCCQDCDEGRDKEDILLLINDILEIC